MTDLKKRRTKYFMQIYKYFVDKVSVLQYNEITDNI